MEAAQSFFCQDICGENTTSKGGLQSELLILTPVPTKQARCLARDVNLNFRSVRRDENGYLSSACCGGKCSEAGGGKETGRKCTAQVLVDKMSETAALQK